jgi:probable O-glycosylation ligase (exosortase A-associated)
MTIPLLRFLQTQLQRHLPPPHDAPDGAVCRCRDRLLLARALIALCAMSLLMWFRGRNRFLGGIAMVAIGAGLVAFMPDMWSARMSSIGDYEEDRSALGRISAWWNAWNSRSTTPSASDSTPRGPELFEIYSPYPTFVHAAHSIYFQVLGNHGFVGLALFLLVWIATWRSAGRLRVAGAAAPETKWCSDLGAMCQASLLGYATGGAFLSLAYFDLPYDILVMVVLTRVWLETNAWEREPASEP